MSGRLRARSLETRYRPPRSAEVSPEVIRRALERGIAVVVVEDCRDDWTRQAVVNEARRQAEATNGK
jgi:hypothetical protein